ncbi:MAG: amino acid adenylation domain-containing protein, partial [bacterium]|nr:amino acid adenylation domain-containing protein [bacterium]
FVCDWEYNTDLFRTDTITRMTRHFQVLLEGILSNPEQPVSLLPLITEAEKQQLLEWNQTDTNYPKDKTIVDLFQEQVEKTPNRVAVVFEEQQLSYQELNTKANQLAHYLLNLGTGSEGSSLSSKSFSHLPIFPPSHLPSFPHLPSLIGLCVERSLELVTGLLAILKAGGAYVPLDPDYPLSRLQFMLQDSSIPLLLTQSHLLERLPVEAVETVCIDNRLELMAAGSVENPIGKSESGDPAYVIYTSGSTGNPKGISVPHTAVVRLVKNTDYIHVDTDDCIAQASNTSFDAATFEIWGSLLNGARLAGISRDVVLSPGDLSLHLRSYRIDILFLTTALFNQIAQTHPHCFGTLKTLLFGGEKVDPYWVSIVLENSPPRNLLHVYGPTESTTFASWYPVKVGEVHNTTYTIPIGTPIANTCIYVLDARTRPQPIGIPGDLCIAGDGLARGYLNRPELTDEQFIRIEIFGQRKRLYKTGDFVRCLSDGNIEFLGRIDHQIKLRGFRIELSEIEVTLSRHEAVKEAVVVLCQKEDNPRLIAYLSPVSGPTLSDAGDERAAVIDPGVLRDWLKARLPEYMIPADFMVLEELPLTPNGKIDRKT